MRKLKLKAIVFRHVRDGTVTHEFIPQQDRTLKIKVVDSQLWYMTRTEIRQLRNFLNKLLPIQSKKRSRPIRSTRASMKDKQRGL